MPGFVCAVIAAAAVIAGLACGGASDTPPKPLSAHFNDEIIAQVPLAQKQTMFEVQNEYSQAKAEKSMASVNLTACATDLEVARNERSSAVLDEKSALSRKKAADESGDQNRVSEAAREMRAAELARRAADLKVEWLESHRAYLKRFLRYTEENSFAREAKFEQAKAKIARDNNIKPKGFDYSVYERQSNERGRRAQEAKSRAERDQQAAESKRRGWDQLYKEALKMGAPDRSAKPTSVPAAQGGSMPGTSAPTDE